MVLKKGDSLPKDFKRAFKDADIRGIYGREINEELSYRIGKAFVKKYNLKKIVVGRDMRVSSPMLLKYFIKGATEAGSDVIDIGLIDTPGLYFYSGKHNLYGAMITASHNPKEYNGIKLVRSGAIPLTKKEGLSDIQKRIVINKFNLPKSRGKIIRKKVLSEYFRYLRSIANIQPPRKIRVVIDAGNGMGSIFEDLLEKYPLKVHKMFFKLDGRFPNRGSNPASSKNTVKIRKKIKSIKKVDLGVAFDGDADRVVFFDENGKAINSSITGCILAKHILNKKKGKIVYTSFTSRSFYETIKKYSGTPVFSRVGHSFIKNKMRENKALFACEHSGHFYFRENFFTDSAIITLLYILEILGDAIKNNQKMSDLVREFCAYFQTEERLIQVKDKRKALKKIKEHYSSLKGAKVYIRDGINVEFDDYWFDLKKSITENALKLIVEAKTKELAIKKEKEVLKKIEMFN